MEARGVRREGADGVHVRKTVTIVFVDVAGSTMLGERLDPEALRDVQTRYFAAVRQPLERHGGTVEKFIGDAVMAVFGIPALHEDDALRAVRAAVEIRAGLAELNRELERDLGVGLEVRIGVNTGEVAGGDVVTDQAFVAGDAVNTAARLQSNAPPGGILIGPQTRRLVETAVRLRPHGARALRGKRRPVRVWLVDDLAEPAARFTRGAAVPLVGRRRELRMLDVRFRRALERERCVLVTVMGAAGVGKSRIVKEFLAGIGDGAAVVSGRCLPYGEGITYWPLIEIVHELAGAGGASALVGLLRGDAQAEVVASRVAAAAGQRGASVTEQDVQWAVRRLFEALGRRRPVVAIFDDVHWAEPAMLDLIEHVAARVAAPVLIVCTARSELMERRPGWDTVGGRGNVIRLEPLSQRESARLLGRLAARRRAPVRRDEVMAAAEGNPLFLEQLVAMRADDPGGRTPPTIQALLAARIDALPPAERRAIEAAAIEGRGFHVGAVRALVRDPAEVDAALGGLIRRELIRPDRAEFPDEDGYRFTHILVRDAAYELLAKRRRAAMHVDYAAWLGGRDDRGSAADEILGYHLEQAYRYRVELGRPDDTRHRDLAETAAGHLSAAGRRVLDAGDRGGAGNLLRRAAALRSADDPDRAALLIDLGGVLREEGRFSEAETTLREALRVAVGLRDAALEARAQVERLLARLQVDPDGVARLAARQGDRLEASLEAARDHAGLARLWHVRALLWWIRANSAEAERAWRRVTKEARRAADDRFVADALGWEASALCVGPTPVSAAIRRCDEIVRRLSRHPWDAALALQPLAALHAMQGDFECAHTLIDQSMAELAAFGETVDGAVSHTRAEVELMAGRPERAVTHLKAGRQILLRMGERALLAGTDGYLAEALVELGDHRGAMRYARACRAATSADDFSAQVIWRRVWARVLSARGRHREALRWGREAIAVAENTDFSNLRAGAQLDLALLLHASGEAAAAKSALSDALAIYRDKANRVGGDAVQRLMSAWEGRAAEARHVVA
ncbi:MAG TPA: adenylate/guanylate cyclase domain-containing protein [Gaiellales bacterium]|nr:adenylate/guanylate cyclase domain-containing protein [Gaiellales bacterium]